MITDFSIECTRRPWSDGVYVIGQGFQWVMSFKLDGKQYHAALMMRDYNPRFASQQFESVVSRRLNAQA